MSQQQFLIWSEEHGAWWRPHRCGYTTSMKNAGRYDALSAEQIVREANAGGQFHEVKVCITYEMEQAIALRGTQVW